MHILVTGGAGYIGSHTCVELLNAGYEVTIFDNLSNSKEDVFDSIEEITGKRPTFVKGDMLDKNDVARAFSQKPVDAVIHFAGFKAVGESVAMPLEYYNNNITGTLNICFEMRKCGCKTLVFSSSATVYGMHNTPPYTEDMPLSTTNPYGSTKLMIEMILRDLYASDNSWQICLLRYFNPIGAHPSGLIGEDPNGIPNNLVPYVAQVAAGKLKCLHIYGNDYPTPDGTGLRDYIHVVDLARGHLKALEYISKTRGAEAINLGTGNGFSVLDVVKSYEKACGKKIAYQIDPRRAGDTAASFAGTEKSKELLCWKAEYNLDDMCAHSWNFAKHRYNVK